MGASIAGRASADITGCGALKQVNTADASVLARVDSAEVGEGLALLSRITKLAIAMIGASLASRNVSTGTQGIGGALVAGIRVDAGVERLAPVRRSDAAGLTCVAKIAQAAEATN